MKLSFNLCYVEQLLFIISHVVDIVSLQLATRTTNTNNNHGQHGEENVEYTVVDDTTTIKNGMEAIHMRPLPMMIVFL